MLLENKRSPRASTQQIIDAIDAFLLQKHLKVTTPVEVNPYLERLGLLNNSDTRAGKPLREMLRRGQIPHAYQVGVHWYIPHSKGTKTPPSEEETLAGSSERKEKEAADEKVINREPTKKLNKLVPIAQLILDLLEKKYGVRPSIYFEYQPTWLMAHPTIALIDKHPELKTIYALLQDDKLELDDKVKELREKDQHKRQLYDIWIAEPFHFAVEFDESQHFNQYRMRTMAFYTKLPTKFPVDFYRQLQANVEIKAGKSGFTRLSSEDPLFPELQEGAKQDNRIRQRAFRDYLKDLLPIENGCEPTLRIPNHITGKRIKGFTAADLEAVERYIETYQLL